MEMFDIFSLCVCVLRVLYFCTITYNAVVSTLAKQKEKINDGGAQRRLFRFWQTDFYFIVKTS